MTRPVTLFTGQWADIPFATMVEKAAGFGYDGLEIACWGDHFSLDRGAEDPDYCQERRDLLQRHGLDAWALGTHLIGQMVLDTNDERSDGWVPAAYAGDSEKKRRWALEQMMKAPRAAKNFGVDVVTGFTGSSIWRWMYPFPPVTEEQIEEGYVRFAHV